MPQGSYPVSFAPYIRSDDPLILKAVLQKWRSLDILKFRIFHFGGGELLFCTSFLYTVWEKSRFPDIIMRSLFSLHVSFTLLAIIAAMDSWFSNDDSLLSASDMEWNSPASPDDGLALKPWDQNDLPSRFDPDFLPQNSGTDPSGFLSWGVNDVSTMGSSFDDLGADHPFDLVDCSSSDHLPLLDNSRVRRNDNGAVCQQKTDGADGGTEVWDIQRIQKALDSWTGAVGRLNGALSGGEQNKFCSLLSFGVLPWGVCSSGNLADEVLEAIDPITIDGNPQNLAYTLSHCTLGMSLDNQSCFFHPATDPGSIDIINRAFSIAQQVSIRADADFRLECYSISRSCGLSQRGPRIDAFLLPNLRRHIGECLFATIQIFQSAISDFAIVSRPV